MTPDSAPRLHQIDLLRGLIIVIMIFDHAMVYCSEHHVSDPMDVPGTEPKVFYLRFASHFCAPLFVFLAWFSSALSETRLKSHRDFVVGLLTRGAVLILMEFTIVSWSWSFNPLFPMLYAQVIWAIGWGFVGLGLLRLLGPRWMLVFGLAVVFGHNALDGVRFGEDTWMHYLWSVLHQKNVLTLPAEFRVRTTYPILPIVGLMCLAYLAGRHYVVQKFSLRAEQHALWLGFACLVAYGALRGGNLYGDSNPFVIRESALLTLMSFLNPTKYPLSLQFILLTVGAGQIVLYLFARSKPTTSKAFLQTLGRTSMFSYVVHLYLLHLISWLLIPIFGFRFADMTYGETLIGLPEGFGLSYVQACGFAACVVALTALLANKYLPWKRAHRHNLIARYL